MRFALEESGRFVDGPLATVQSQPDNQPANARQRLTRLREPISRIVALEAFVADQLFRVVRPAVLPRRRLRKGIEPNPDSAHLAGRAPHEEAVYIVTGRDLVRRDVR